MSADRPPCTALSHHAQKAKSTKKPAKKPVKKAVKAKKEESEDDGPDSGAESDASSGGKAPDAGPGGLNTDDEGNAFVTLGNEYKRVTVSAFKGQVYMNIREVSREDR